MKIRNALLSVSDKTGLVELARALRASGTALYASGGTLKALRDAGIEAEEAQALSGSPEAFDGRMKTLSFPIFGGILFNRSSAEDREQVEKLGLKPIDAVIVNFYPFEKAKPDAAREERVELIDIGGPALVRAAAKNSPDVLVLVDPSQYAGVTKDLERTGEVSATTCESAAARAWTRVLEYDRAIADVFGETAPAAETSRLPLRYGENPHQQAWVTLEANAPLKWNLPLTEQALSYNNILDFASAYRLARDLKLLFPKHASCVIVKHNNPCGVASVPLSEPQALLRALELAWEGDPVSAFGGIVVTTHPLDAEFAHTLAPRFIEGIAAPDLHPESNELQILLKKRKGLKAVRVEHFADEAPRAQEISIPGGKLVQTEDRNLDERLDLVTGPATAWTDAQTSLARFGVLVTRALKSNAIAVVVSPEPHAFQLVGAGQGQPNRVDALATLAIPRARKVLGEKSLEGAILVSDAFFPFRDSIDLAAQAGIRAIVQPGGSIRDEEVKTAAREHGIAMAFTGVRHFRH